MFTLHRKTDNFMKREAGKSGIKIMWLLHTDNLTVVCPNDSPNILEPRIPSMIIIQIIYVKHDE